MTEKYTERDMLDRLAVKYFSEQYVFAEHVNNGAGFSFGRTLDAIVFDTYPSKGLMLHGFEVKVSKADFRKEIQHLEKSQAFTTYLDTFSIVAPKGIVDIELLPPRWGLYLPDGDDSLRAKRKPVMLDPERDRSVVDRSLMAAFCRAVMARGCVGAEWKTRQENYEREANRRVERKLSDLQDHNDELKGRIDRFEEQSGIRLSRYSGGNIGKAVALLNQHMISSDHYHIDSVRRHAQSVLESVEGLCKVLEEAGEAS